MGLTVLFAAMGLAVGIPLDAHTGWDATTTRGSRRFDREAAHEEPYCLVVSHPCSPWGQWSRYNIQKGGETAAKILQKREYSRPILKEVNRSVVYRVTRGGHVVIEQPRDSESYHQPEMDGIQRLLNQGILKSVTFHGCQVGY